jgi:hypothetical protein
LIRKQNCLSLAGGFFVVESVGTFHFKGEKMDEKEREKLIDLCVDIFAHEEMEQEIVLCGKETYATEASKVAKVILRILKVSRRSIQSLIMNRAEELSEFELEEINFELTRKPPPHGGLFVQ